MADINTNPVSVTTPTVDTSSWNTPSMAPSFVSMQQPTSFTPDPAMPKVADRSAEINAFIGSIRYDAMSSIGQKSKKSEWLSAIDPSQGKMQTTSQVALTDTHELLNDGETWMPKYKSYLEGVDNDTRLSNQQSDWEKFSNPIKRFGSNTSKGVLDIGSFVYGIGAAAVSGRFDALYDNAMSRYVDDFTAQTNFKYKNYYDQATKDKSLGLDLQTWDKVLGGAEFTARMFASEAVIALASGGTSVPASFARAGYKAGMALDKASDIAKTIATGKKISKMTTMATAPERMTAEASNIAKGYERVLNANKEAISKGKWGDRLVQARFAVTSPMYEAGFEAMHFRKEAEQNFYDYYKRNGIEPTTEDINAFSEKLSGASNAVFGANMAILSVSNLALFGDLLSVKNPLAKSVFSPSQFFKKNVFKSTTEKVAETGLYQASKAGILNKTAAYLSPIVKGMVIEGVYEEGSQGIASGTLKNYVASAYDSEAMKNTANYVDSFGKAFGDQFSTKEGQEEIIIGAIIGGLFGGVGGVKSQAREYSQQKDIAKLQNKGQEFVDTFKSNSYTNEQLLSLFSGANRFQKLRDELEKAELQDDNLKQAAIKAQSFISLLDSYHSVGKEGEFIQMFESMFKGMDNKSIAEATGLDLSEIDGFKQSQIQGMNDISKAYSTAREAGRYLFRPNTGGFTEAEIDGKKVRVNSESMASSYAFASTMGFFNNKFAVETFDAFQTKLAELNGSPELIEKLGAVTVLKRLGTLESAKYSTLAGEENKLRLKLGQITKKVNLLSQGEDKTEYARQALELSQQLADTQSELTRVSAKKDSLWKSAVDNFYSEMGKTGYATQLDLENFESQVQDIQDSLDGLNIKPEDKIILENLMEQFNKSNTAYKSFTDLTNKLADPKFAFKTYRGILSGTRAKMDVSLNEHTKDAMLKIYNYDRNPYGVDEDLIEKPETVEKVPVNDPLNEESDLTNIDNLSIRKNALDQELQNLENQEYSQELQSKIDKINSEIQDLKNQIEEILTKNIATLSNGSQVKTSISNGDKIIKVNTKSLNNEIKNTEGDVFITADKNSEGRIYININPLKDILVVPNNNLIIIDKTTGKEIVNKELNKEGAVVFEAMQGRLFVVANINGQNVPFYKSSAGTSGKTQGEWYPFFGYTGAWLVKGSVNKTTGKMSYSSEIDRVTNLLNENLIFPDKYIDRSTNTISDKNGKVLVDMNNYFKINRLWKKEFNSQTGDTTNYKVKGLKENTRSESSLVALITGLNTTQVDSSTPNEVYEWIDLINKNIEDSLQKDNTNVDNSKLDQEIQDLGKEIQDLEKEIQDLEQSGKVNQTKVQQGRDIRKQNYTQYEYTTPKGDVLLGWLETRTNGKIFFVTEDGYFNYIGEARSTTVANLKDLREIKEEDVLIEGKEIYVNGKIYKLGLKNPTLDQSISKDKSGNYQVTLQARNGRMVTLTGNVADTIVYQHLLNKLEQDATETEIRELREQAERDAKITRKYEELISKTEDRDSRISQVEQERYNAEKELNSKRSELESQIKEKEVQIESQIQSEKIRIENDIASVNGEISKEEKIQRLENEVKALRDEIILENSEEDLEDEIMYYDSLNDKEFEDELKRDLNSIQKMKTWDKVKSLNPFDTVKYEIAGLTYYTDSVADATDMINDYYRNIERKSQDSESSQIDIKKIQRLLLLEKELKDLKSQKEEFNPNGTPLEQLEWVVKNVPALNFGSADGLSDLKNPSQSDVDEYVELTKTRNRNSQQKKRTAELRDKLLPFNLAQGLDIDGLNIIDIINLYNQSKNKQEVQNTQENQITEDDFKQNNQVAQGKPEFRSPNTGLVYDGAYIERSDGIEKVFHIKLTTFLTKALEKGNKPRIVIMHKSGRSNEVPEQVIQVDASNVSQLGEMFDKVDNIKVDLNDDGLFLKKPTGQTSFHVYGQGLLPLIDSEAYYIKGQSTGYVLIYNQKSDGSFGARESEFFVSRDGVIIPFDKKELNSIKPGDTVTMEFDPLDDYNKTLPKKDYKTKGNIYVKKNGKLVQILKATNDVKKSDKDAWSDLEATRKKVVESKTPVTITVQKSYLGLPIVELSSDLSVKENLVDDSKVVAYGYIDLNGELQGDIKSTKLDNTQYIEPLEKSGKIIPVMAIKTNGMTIGVPLNLKPKGVDLSQDVDNIMNAELSREQKMFQINDLLEQNQMFTEDLAVDATNFDVNKVKTALEQVYSKIDVTDPIQFENADKYSYIDLRDPFMSSKLVFEFEKPDDQILDVGDSVKDLVIQLLNTADMKGADASNNNYC